MSQNVNVIISEDDLEKFRDCWAEYDKDVSEWIITITISIGHWLHIDPGFAILPFGPGSPSRLGPGHLRCQLECPGRFSRGAEYQDIQGVSELPLLGRASRPHKDVHYQNAHYQGNDGGHGISHG